MSGKIAKSISCLFLLLLTGLVARGQCPPIYTYTGDMVEARLGNFVASAGDVNADGFEDFIVAARKRDNLRGAVYVYSGRTGENIHTFIGEEEHSYFGVSVASAGDVNNDGYDDIIIGANLAGKAYVFSGLTGDTLYTYSSNDWMGIEVSPAGDIDKDGYDDFMISDTWYNYHRGGVFVFSGQTGDTLFTFVGENANAEDQFGWSTATLGDINDDGYPDLIIGAHGFDDYRGKAYVYSGQTGNLLYTFTGEQTPDMFGHFFAHCVTSAGDINNDGYNDILIGSSSFDIGEIYSIGRAYIFSGLTGDTLYVFDGEAKGDRFGLSASSIGDIDNDGFDDIIIGAPDNNEGGEWAGKIYVFSGQTGTLISTILGKPYDHIGTFSISAADVNNDGFKDIIYGAIQNDIGGENAGQAYVVSGRPCGMVINVPDDQLTIQAGIDYAVPGDTVLVADGTYTGEGNRDLDFHGKNIVLMSENGSEATIIDCGGMARGFNFHSGEDTTSVVQGFTITGGLAVEGGGIYISNSGPKIVGNVISGNAAGVPDWNGTLYGGFGAGIYCAGNGTPLIDSNRISGNQFDWLGQGTAIYCDSSNLTITNNIISNNSQSCHSMYGGLVVIQSNLVFRGNIVSDNFSWSGGSVEFHNSTVEFAENIVRDNFNLENGGAISCTGSELTMTNSIILNNQVAWQSSGCNQKSLSEAWHRSEQYPGIRRALAILDTISMIPDISVSTPKQTEITYGTTSAATVTNCIFWGNSQPEVNIVDADELSVRFSVVRDGWPGVGNLDVDPLFVDPSSDDLTVCAESPCIDAGDPAISDPDNSRSDIGLFQIDHPDCNPGTVWHVAADGNNLLGDGSAAAPFQTIQDAVDAAHSGDTVLVERGTYNETVDIYVKGPVITSRYIYTGDSADITETVIISAQDSSSVRSWGNGSLCKLTGFTITSEQSTQYHFPGVICEGSGIHISDNIIARTCGRGIFVGCGSNPIIEANIIDSNRCAIELNSRSSGQIKNNTIIRNYSGHVPEAGINCWDSNPVIEGNTIYDNGGGIYLYYTPVIEMKGNVIFGNDYGVVIAGGADAVFDGNTIAANGLGISVEYISQITIKNCIISYQLGSGLAVCKHDLDLSIMNTDIYGNANGDWIDCIADLADINGNFSADPLFCDTASGNYHLSGFSPCAPANSESGELIGALGVGCDFEFVQVYFDIKPGSCPNPINIKIKENGKAVIPAAILGTEDFDVHDIDVGSLTLMGVSPIRYNYDDVSAPAETDDSCGCSDDGPDGHEDLTLKFNRQALVAALMQQPLTETMTLTISGQLIDSTSIEGSDCVVIRPNRYGEIVGLGGGSGNIIVISGDVSGDNQVNLVDVALMIEFLYRDGKNAAFTVEAADVNATGTVNILDITYLIAYLYKEGPEPVCQ